MKSKIVLMVLMCVLVVTISLQAETFHVHTGMDYQRATIKAIAGDTVLIHASVKAIDQFRAGVLIVPARSHRIVVDDWDTFTMRITGANPGDTVVVRCPLVTTQYNLISVKEGIVIIFEKLDWNQILEKYK